MQTVHIDQLVDLDADRDLREDRGDVDALAESIAELGLLEPLTVIPREDGRFTIYAGHRRRDAVRRAAELLVADPDHYDLSAEQAAARAEQLQHVPCYERPDLAGRDVLTQIAENGERLSLTDAERARGLQLALVDGLDARAISRATGIKLATVRAAEKVAALPEAAQKALATGQLGLDEAASLDEFADDAKAVERILRGSHIGYALAEERHKRDRKAKAAQLREQLTADGYVLVSKPKDFPWSSREAKLRDLADAEGNPLTVEEYGLADKHAVFIDSASYAEPRPVHICRDPEAHGHTRLSHTGYVSPEEIARREAEEAARREHAEKMSAARDVRAKFLRSLIGSQKAAAKHTDLLLTIAARWPDLIDAGHRHPLAEQLSPQPEQWTPARIQQRAVATAVLGIDDHAERLRGWHVKHEAALWWWDQLTTLGYEITPAEVEHRAATQAAYAAEQAARAAEQAARAAAEDNVDEDQEDEDQEDEPGADEAGQDSEHDAPAA